MLFCNIQIFDNVTGNEGTTAINRLGLVTISKIKNQIKALIHDAKDPLRIIPNEQIMIARSSSATVMSQTLRESQILK
jgi:hypothetical protein